VIRFLHTGDWQLGMTRHFFSEGVQERFAQSRFDAIRRLGRIAVEEGCRFMVVCGDVFESNLVDRGTVSRAVEALKEVPVPVYLLPGNHDPLNAASVYRSPAFLERKPDHVHVIEDMAPIQAGSDVEIVGAPWTSKRPLQDLVAACIGSLEPALDKVRICVAHGMVDTLSPDRDDPAAISLPSAEKAVREGRIHYLALGDRHSLTRAGETGRICYAGSPEPTGFREANSGFALVVDLGRERVETRAIEVGNWRFIERERVDLNTPEDIEALGRWLEGVPDKERAAVKLRFVGAVSLMVHDRLERMLSFYSEIFGALEVRTGDLVVAPEDGDFAEFGFSGFARRTVERLRRHVLDAGSLAPSAGDALGLLMRLAGKTK